MLKIRNGKIGHKKRNFVITSKEENDAKFIGSSTCLQ